MKKAVGIVVLMAAGMLVASCGYSAPSNQATPTSGLKFRAFVSNPLAPATGGGGAPVLNIVDASKDVLSRSLINLSGSSNQPGMMAVSPSKKFTMIFSGLSNSVALVDNTSETVVQAGSRSLPAVTLPDFTESMFVSKFNTVGYMAVPNTPVLGQSPGAVIVVALANAVISASIPVPGAHHVFESHDGNHILALSDSAGTATSIAPSLIGTTTDPRTAITGSFDHPVWGIFGADDSQAYVFNCGQQCGGGAAGITVVDMTTNSATATIPVAAATVGLLSGNTLYVAGTPPNTPCGSGTAATTCGTLSIVDLGTMTVTGTATISDGYHTRMEMGANGQLFIGAKSCTNMNIPAGNGNPGEIRGCLSIFNTQNSKVVIAPDNGDVTGIQPITNRSVVYVAEGGELRIYDTTTDALQTTQIDIIGQAMDVKLVDP